MQIPATKKAAATESLPYPRGDSVRAGSMDGAPLLPTRLNESVVHFAPGPLSITDKDQISGDEAYEAPRAQQPKPRVKSVVGRPGTMMRNAGNIRIDKRTRTDTLVHKTRWSRCCYAVALLVRHFWI